MSYFVYCNKCWTLPSRSLKYFLTQCGHIFCHNCVAQVKSAKKCLCCNKPTAVVQINKDAGPNVTDFFMPIAALQKKIMEIDQFQMQRRTSYTEFLQKLNHDYRSQLAKVQEENKRLAAQVEVLKAKLLQHHASPAGSSNSRDSGSKRAFQSSTPMSHVQKMNVNVQQDVQHHAFHGGSSNSHGSGSIRSQASVSMSRAMGVTSSQIDDDIYVTSRQNHRSAGYLKNNTPSPHSIHSGYTKRAMMASTGGRIGYSVVTGSGSSRSSNQQQRVPTSGSLYQRRPLQPPTPVLHQQKQAGRKTSLDYLRSMVTSRYSK